MIMYTGTSIEEKSLSTAVSENQLKKNQINTLSIDSAKIKCSELGFKPETEGYGKCILQLSRQIKYSLCVYV